MEQALQKIEYYQKVLQVKRVVKSVKGGKICTYKVSMIVGDYDSNVGIGIGRADNTVIAINKAFINAKQNLISVPITKNKSIPGKIAIAQGACKIILIPANEGNGIIASGPIKTLMEYGGIKNITAKQFGSNNILNNVKASLLALIVLKDRVEFLKMRSNKSYSFYGTRMKNIKR